MRSAFAYLPRPGPLQAASPAAAACYLGALTTVAFLYLNPLVLLAVGAATVLAGCLAGAARAVRTALRMGLTLALFLALVNALLVDRGQTVLARLGEWPLLGRVDVTAEALVAGLAYGLRTLVVLVAFAVYSACVDPDRVLRALRPLAARSALTATLVSRLVPVAAADAARLREAAELRGPDAAPLGRPPLARRLLAGSLDRAVDVAATLELRGYGLGVAAAPGAVRGRRSRFDRRFYAAGALVLAAGVAGKLLGADDFRTYPTLSIGFGAATLALAAVLALSGLAPLRRRPARRHADMALDASAQASPAKALRGPGAAPLPEVPGGL
ncbi:MAG TPA: energy-coupling factor transporter transmembrane component T [Solirubrobacterales bacterium]|jgi:energy-coupling factor transport system permease protein|nr:energy-coupling factor transporter transmembrane component T [Solirubrobacterales bacterium]